MVQAWAAKEGSNENRTFSARNTFPGVVDPCSVHSCEAGAVRQLGPGLEAGRAPAARLCDVARPLCAGAEGRTSGGKLRARGERGSRMESRIFHGKYVEFEVSIFFRQVCGKRGRNIVAPPLRGRGTWSPPPAVGRPRGRATGHRCPCTGHRPSASTGTSK